MLSDIFHKGLRLAPRIAAMLLLSEAITAKTTHLNLSRALGAKLAVHITLECEPIGFSGVFALCAKFLVMRQHGALVIPFDKAKVNCFWLNLAASWSKCSTSLPSYLTRYANRLCATVPFPPGEHRCTEKRRPV